MNISSMWNVLYWAWVLSEIAVAFKTLTRRRTGTVRDRGSLFVLWVVVGTSLFLGIYLGETRPHTLFGGAPWVREIALVMLAVGLALRWTAIATLGKSFSVNVVIHASQTVHKTGLFRFVRHPSYTALVIIFAAIGVHTRNWIGLTLTVIPPVAALLYRIHVEEIALRDAFGEEYVAYSRITRRLFPGIY